MCKLFTRLPCCEERPLSLLLVFAHANGMQCWRLRCDRSDECTLPKYKRCLHISRGLVSKFEFGINTRLRCSSKVFLIEVCIMLIATEITQVWIAKTTWDPMPSMFSCGRGIITKCQKLIQLRGAFVAHQQHAAKGSRNNTP